jgi:hypothetical protein
VAPLLEPAHLRRGRLRQHEELRHRQHPPRHTQFTGRALITLGLTAAVVAYNLRELENWHARASKHCPDNALLRTYEQHPLHQPTNWVHGFTMFTAEQRAQWEREWLRERQQAGQVTDLPAAA